VYVSMITL